MERIFCHGSFRMAPFLNVRTPKLKLLFAHALGQQEKLPSNKCALTDFKPQQMLQNFSIPADDRCLSNQPFALSLCFESSALSFCFGKICLDICISACPGDASCQDRKRFE